MHVNGSENFFLESFQTQSIAITNLRIRVAHTRRRHLWCSSSPFSGKCTVIQTVSISFVVGAHFVSVMKALTEYFLARRWKV